MINMLFSQYNFHEEWASSTLKNYIKDAHHVLVIPFSFGENISNDETWQNAYNKLNGIYYPSLVKPFLSYGVKEKNIQFINYFKDNKDDVKKKIKDSDILFFTGGYPDKMMERIKEFNMIETIEQFNGIIIGCSAGAMIQFDTFHISPDEFYPELTYHKGLHLIRNFGIEVHYEPTLKKYIEQVLAEKTKSIYAITDTGGMMIHNGQVTLLGEVIHFQKEVTR